MTRRMLLTLAIEVDQQPGRILDAFARYLQANPSCSITLSMAADGDRRWLVEVTDHRPGRGVTLRDACAQTAQAMVLEEEALS